MRVTDASAVRPMNRFQAKIAATYQIMERVKPGKRISI
jgi:hypothetical protein